MRVFVYWNLHKDCYSIRALEGANKGRVIAHADAVELSDVTFPVGNAGRLQSITGHKSVHAGMRGTLISTAPMTPTGMRAITYNPRKHETFVCRDNLEPIHNAKRAIGLIADGRAQCFSSTD